jgi:hypothetical protein
MISKVTWTQAGQITEPGRYMLRFGWLTVSAEDLAIWKQFPNATFTLVSAEPSTDGDEYRLGSFDIGEGK